MNSSRQHDRKRLLLCASVFLLLCVPRNVAVQAAETHAVPEAMSPAEYVTQSLQEADENFERQDFWSAYELYQRVVEFDPSHRVARGKVYEIAKIYQALEEVARQEQNTKQAEIFHQQYRSIVRTLLGVLTAQLKRAISTYNKYKKEKDVSGEHIQENILNALDNILTILHEFRDIYEQCPRDEATMEQMVEKIDAAISKYTQEYTQYQNTP